MKVTWKDVITTLAAAGAVVAERAYFHSWNWPLVTNLRWAIAALVVLGAISFVFSLMKETGWAIALYIVGGLGVIVASAGLITGTTDYLVVLMLDVIALWATSLMGHLLAPTGQVAHHA